MATLSDIQKGIRARKAIALPIGDARADMSAEWSGPTVTVDVRPLLPSEDALVLEKARAFAVKNGEADPSDGDPLYDFGVQLYTLLLGCIDHDSPADAPKPFFDGGVEQILNCEQLSRDHIAYLFEQIELWRAQCSPRALKLGHDDFVRAALRTAEGDMVPFSQLQPGARWIFVRTLARLAQSSLLPKSSSGSTSEAST